MAEKTAVAENEVRVGERRIKLPPIERTIVIEIPRRDAEGDGAVDLESLVGRGTRYDVIVSSDEPGEQYYWDLGYIREVLSHKKSAIRLERLTKRGPLLWNHISGDQIGRVHDPEVDEGAGQLRCQIRYSRTPRGREFELDALDDIKVAISVRYIVYEMVLVRMGDRDKGELDEYLITDWEPLEVSIVSIPLDITAGLRQQHAEALMAARSKQGGQEYPVLIRGLAPVTEERSEQVAGESGAQGGGAATIEVGLHQRNKEVQEIFEMCRDAGLQEKFPEFLAEGLTADQAARKILGEKKTVGRAQAAPESIVELSDKERRKGHYSFARAILLAADRSLGQRECGAELEMHNHLEKFLPEGYKRRGGILAPMRLKPAPKSYDEAVERSLDDYARMHGLRRVEGQRTLNVTGANQGKDFIFTEPGDFIDMLLPRSVAFRLGATVFTDLQGNVAFPRQTTDPTMEWVADNPGASGSESSPGTDQVPMSPKNLRGRTHYTRQFLSQSTIAAEQFVRSRLARAGRMTIDKASVHGTGASNQPTGIYSASGVLSVSMGGTPTAPTFAKLVDMTGQAADANADGGSQGFAMTALLAATLRKTLEFPTAPGGQAIWQGRYDEGVVAGYRAITSGLLSKTLGAGSEHAVVFGNWEELALGFWGIIEIVVDPYSVAEQGIIRVIFWQLADIALFHGASFVKGTNAIP